MDKVFNSLNNQPVIAMDEFALGALYSLFKYAPMLSHSLLSQAVVAQATIESFISDRMYVPKDSGGVTIPILTGESVFKLAQRWDELFVMDYAEQLPVITDEQAVEFKAWLGREFEKGVTHTDLQTCCAFVGQLEELYIKVIKARRAK